MATKATTKASARSSSAVLKSILEEIRLLRNEVSLLFPFENLEDYAHPARLKRSYEKALKEYPPASSWK